MNNQALALFFILLSIPLSLRADTHTLDNIRGTITIPQLEGWELAKNVFGMPYIYFSPKANGQKSNISFTHSGVEFPFRPEEMDESLVKYRKLKREWTEKVGAEFDSVLNHEVRETLLGHRVYQFGFTYTFNASDYIEKSYYIDCGGDMLFVKSLRLRVNEAHDAQFDQLIGGINCNRSADER